MLAAPEDMDVDALRGALARGWGITVVAMEYLAVGWGSHHWDVRDEAGRRWFVTAAIAIGMMPRSGAVVFNVSKSFLAV